jgi:hypothetical protein
MLIFTAAFCFWFGFTASIALCLVPLTERRS